MKKDRVQFVAGEQQKFIDAAFVRSNCSAKELAAICGVHVRSFRDWRNEKLRMTLYAVEVLYKKYNLVLPEDKSSLVQRWKISQQQANRIGGISLMKKYGSLATLEGRKKGGKNSWIKRQKMSLIWKKYGAIFTKPGESTELAEFVGIMLGDGGLTHFQCSIYLNSDTDIIFADYVRILIKNLFSLESSMHRHKKDKVLRISISSVSLVEYLTKRGLSIGNKVQLQVGVPQWVWSKPEYVKACIRGLIDTDGCFVRHKYKVNGEEYIYSKISFSNRSLPLLEFVYQGLLYFGFKPRRYAEKQIWIDSHREVKRYLVDIGTRNYKPAIKIILEGGPDGKAQVC